MGAGTLSVIGTWMQGATQAWLLLQLSGSGALLGAGVALNALPSLLLGPWAGVLADRFPRPRVLLITRITFAAFAAAQGLLAFRGSLTVVLLLVFSLITGLVGVVDSPAAGALGSTLVPVEDLPNAVALGSATNSLGRIVGMSGAGVAIAAAGPGLAYLINAAAFLPTIAVLVAFRHRAAAPRDQEPQRPWTALKEGLRFVVGARDLRWVLGLAFILGALGRSYQVTMALMVENVLGGEASGYAAASTAFAVGAFGGAIVAAHLRQVTGRVVLLAGGAGSVGQLAAGAAPTMLVFVAIIVAVAAAAVVLDTAVSTRVAVAAPDHLRGRVLAVAGAAGAGAGAVGGPLLGAMAEALGSRSPFLVGGAICVSACVLARRGVTAETTTTAATAPVQVLDAPLDEATDSPLAIAA